MSSYDVAIVGGGIVGLSTAHALAHERPDAKVVVLEKESRVAAHQSGHNSGVVHSGIYYPPGSLKARLVAAARQPLIDLCERHGIPIDFAGKVIVATQDRELAALRSLAERGAAHGLHVEWLEPDQLRRVEPHASGVAALRVPEAGCTDFKAVTEIIASEIADAGVDIQLNARVLDIHESDGEVVVRTASTDLTAGHVVVCAGLQSTRLATATASAGQPNVMIVPFRGEYYELKPSARSLVTSMIYPVPDPRLPFLGVHLTRGIDGTVHVGPNAVPALAVEGYRWRDIDPRYLRELLTFPGTRHLARRYWRTGLGELSRSVSKGAFAREVRRLVPDVTADMLQRSPSGVRAQALERQGGLVDDFTFRCSSRIVHVDNAPSPAATASLAIGTHIATMLR
jgi:L-2-hydroxyglutarate oxidase